MSEEVFEIPLEDPPVQPVSESYQSEIGTGENINDPSSTVIKKIKTKRKYKISDEKREILKANLAKGRETMRLRREQRKKELISLKAENETLKKDGRHQSEISTGKNVITTARPHESVQADDSHVSHQSKISTNPSRSQELPYKKPVQCCTTPVQQKPQIIYSFKKKK
jgi:hypothetical protein